MTPRQAELVQSSWTALLQSSDAAAEDIARQFYDKLFDLDPSLSILFTLEVGSLTLVNASDQAFARISGPIFRIK